VARKPDSLPYPPKIQKYKTDNLIDEGLVLVGWYFGGKKSPCQYYLKVNARRRGGPPTGEKHVGGGAMPWPRMPCPWPRPTTAQQKFEEEKKKRARKRVPFHISFPSEASSSNGNSYDVTPHRQNSRPLPLAPTCPLATLGPPSLFIHRSIKQNNSTPIPFRVNGFTCTLRMCSATPPFPSWTRKRIWGDVMGLQFWDYHRLLLIMGYIGIQLLKLSYFGSQSLPLSTDGEKGRK